jgi:hypothetical protein
MPVARSMVTHSAILTGPGIDGGNAGVGAGTGAGGAGGGGGTGMDTGDGADDGGEADDGRLYCWCQVGSYGDMVACDDNECEREWVSVLSLLPLNSESDRRLAPHPSPSFWLGVSACAWAWACDSVLTYLFCPLSSITVPFGVHWARGGPGGRVVLRGMQSQAQESAQVGARGRLGRR